MTHKIELDDLLRDVRACRHCADTLPLGPRPIVQAGVGARVLIIGQAPGTRVHETGVPWHDASGDRLRDWLDVDTAHFYDPLRFALMPMGFCYPGKDKAGDLPPRSECAPLWHDRLRGLLPEVRLTILVGQYAQARYLSDQPKRSMTEHVRHFDLHLPDYFPLPHPSWRSTMWQRNNPWFLDSVVPRLRAEVAHALSD
jgi:uracil-DNA glycosylase